MSGCWLLHDNTEQEMYILRFPACRKTQRTRRQLRIRKISLIHALVLAHSRSTQFAMFIPCFSLTSQKQRDDYIQYTTFATNSNNNMRHTTDGGIARWSDVLLVRVYWCKGTASLSTSNTANLCKCVCDAREYLALLLNRSASSTTAATATAAAPIRENGNRDSSQQQS